MSYVVGCKASYSALLAHSVEHFHGKEEVVGSIPTEGSVIQGDVAQLVRASGS